MSRGCYESAARKLVLWNLSVTSHLRHTVAGTKQRCEQSVCPSVRPCLNWAFHFISGRVGEVGYYTGGADGWVERLSCIDAGERRAETDSVLEEAERCSRTVEQQADRRRVVLTERRRVLATPAHATRLYRRHRISG